MTWRDLAAGFQLLRNLPSMLRQPVDPAEARFDLGARLSERSDNLLRLARRAIFEHPASPYAELLRLAGCEEGDLIRLVADEGLEGALTVLQRRGVYLTVDEFKGRRAAVRGSATVEIGPGALVNPSSAVHFPMQSSGSRGARTPVAFDLTFGRAILGDMRLALEARGGIGWQHAAWSVPGGSGLGLMFAFRAMGVPAVRWFWQIDPGAQGLHPRYRWSARAAGWWCALIGARLPTPELVPLCDPLPIARWMEQVLRTGGTPHLHTFASPAVRLCRAALAAGINLSGAQLTVGGEPLTETRQEIFRRAGVQADTVYGAMEAAILGQACGAPAAADDAHVVADLHALIQAGTDGAAAGLPPRALLVTSLHAKAPLVLLNVSLGDQAELVKRRCGCALEALGWSDHLHNIRSFEKLTAGGMTFFDADVIQVLEADLPARFGGGPTDYQLIEDEDDGGQPRLRLLVHPSLGPLDEGAVADTFLTALGATSDAERVMELQWRAAGLLTVERGEPRTTSSGKIHHLHLNRAGLARR